MVSNRANGWLWTFQMHGPVLSHFLTVLSKMAWVDKETPTEDRFIHAMMNNRLHTLVFSDEFNTDARRFSGESDSKWKV
jgi:hypothetical protein